MNSKNRLLSYIFFVTGVAVLGAVGLFAWHTSLAEKVVLGSSVPPEIAGFPLAQEISGQEAIDSIHELHGKDFVLVDGAVAAYGVQNVILWVSDAGSESAAADLTELMKVRIAEGRSPFSDQGSFDVDGFLVYALDGLGQTHYAGNLAGSCSGWLLTAILPSAPCRKPSFFINHRSQHDPSL